MPDIPLMRPLWRDGGNGLGNGSPPITDRSLPLDALLLQFPEHQCPTLSIHRDRTGAGPDRPAVHIDHIERGVTMLGSGKFIQGQGPHAGRRMRAHPLLGKLSRCLHHAGNRAQADLLTQQGPQALLEAPIAGVALHQQRQDRPLQWVLAVGTLGSRGKRCFQGCLSLGFPSLERLASDTHLLAQPTDDSIAACVGQQPADPLCVVLGGARMCLDHWFLPGGGDVFYQPSLPGSFLARATSHTVTSFSRSFEPCLRKRI